MTWSFCEDDEKNIWIGSESGPVNVYNPKTKTFRQVTISDNNGNIASNIYKMVYNDGIFWIASFNAGLVRYEKYTGKAKFYRGAHNSPLGKITMINELMLDDDNTLWIGTKSSSIPIRS